MMNLEQNHPKIISVKAKLAAAYQALAVLNMDDHIYTHLSARLSSDSFAFPPFGLMYEEITASKLLTLNLHEVTSQVNNPGFLIHSEIYKERPDIHFIFHLHTSAITAVSADKRGLMPLTQWAHFFYGQIAYHDYDSIVTEQTEMKKMTTDLGDKNILMMRNHGATLCASTIEEVFFNTLYLEKACEAQCRLAHIPPEHLIIPPHEICKHTYEVHQGTEIPFGFQSFQAMLRKLDRLGIDYAN